MEYQRKVDETGHIDDIENQAGYYTGEPILTIFNTHINSGTKFLPPTLGRIAWADNLYNGEPYFYLPVALAFSETGGWLVMRERHFAPYYFTVLAQRYSAYLRVRGYENTAFIFESFKGDMKWGRGKALINGANIENIHIIHALAAYISQ